MVCYNPMDMKQTTPLYFAALAIIIDALTLVAAREFVPRGVTAMSTPAGMNALIITVIFLLFAIGVYLIRRLNATSWGTSEWLTRGRRSALALTFAFFLSLTLAWQLGFFESAPQVDTTQMGEGASASYFVFGPGAWLAFSLLYVLVFAFNVEPSVDFGPGYWVVAAIGLAFSATMLLVMVAQAQAMALAIGAAWWGIIAFVVLTLLFLPPRMLYLSRTMSLRSPPAYAAMATLVLVLAVFAVQMMV